MKFYLVTCARGHCGNRKSSVISFAFKAASVIEAMDMAKTMPSVKHSRSCLNAREIDEAEYYEYRSVSAYERAGQWAAATYKGHVWVQPKGQHKKKRR